MGKKSLTDERDGGCGGIMGSVAAADAAAGAAAARFSSAQVSQVVGGSREQRHREQGRGAVVVDKGQRALDRPQPPIRFTSQARVGSEGEC